MRTSPLAPQTADIAGTFGAVGVSESVSLRRSRSDPRLGIPLPVGGVRVSLARQEKGFSLGGCALKHRGS